MAMSTPNADTTGASNGVSLLATVSIDDHAQEATLDDFQSDFQYNVSIRTRARPSDR